MEKKLLVTGKINNSKELCLRLKELILLLENQTGTTMLCLKELLLIWKYLLPTLTLLRLVSYITLEVWQLVHLLLPIPENITTSNMIGILTEVCKRQSIPEPDYLVITLMDQMIGYKLALNSVFLSQCLSMLLGINLIHGVELWISVWALIMITFSLPIAEEVKISDSM